MLLELYDLGIETRSLHLIFGVIIGLVFGVAAQISRFCLRRAVAGDETERGTAGAVWITALATAVLSFQIAGSFGLVAVEDHRFLSNDIPVLAIVLGGLAFGAGMVLTRGCVSRLTVLSATGNLRAAFVLVVFAIVAHATLKGVLAPVRVWLGSFNETLPVASLGGLPYGALLAGSAIAIAAIYAVQKFRPRGLHLVLGVLIGLLPVLGWMGTSTLFFDEFDPLPVQSVAFTLPWSDGLFWVIASSAIPAGFGVGLVGGVLVGSFLSAVARSELALQSFESGGQTLRYSLGGVLMGFGGVVAGGCSVGAGLSGVSMLSIAAILALLGIIAGAAIMHRVISDQLATQTA